MVTILFINFLGLLSPGPDFMYVSRKSLNEGKYHGMAAAFGIGLGIFFWSGASILTLSLLNSTNNLVQYIIMCLGGAYLSYSGLTIIKHTAKNTAIEHGISDFNQSNDNILRQVFKGLLINLSNAKVIVFFASVLSGFIADIFSWTDMLLISLLLGLETFVYFSIIAFFFSRNSVRNFYVKNKTCVDYISGLIFLYFGCGLIYTGISTLVTLS
ncbi:LysE family translocator [Seminibacterium arietis]|uniref:LysE family translocator n=1 Tax=Seminibacterium arietis TaxID=1173502 RepID=A0ABW3IAG4_9PAST